MGGGKIRPSFPFRKITKGKKQEIAFEKFSWNSFSFSEKIRNVQKKCIKAFLGFSSSLFLASASRNVFLNIHLIIGLKARDGGIIFADDKSRNKWGKEGLLNGIGEKFSGRIRSKMQEKKLFRVKLLLGAWEERTNEGSSVSCNNFSTKSFNLSIDGLNLLPQLQLLYPLYVLKLFSLLFYSQLA